MRPACGQEACADPRRRAAPRPRGRAASHAQVERLAVGDADLLLDEVEAGDRLGDRVLDLDAAVQLEEEELAAVEHELRRAGADVADRARRSGSRPRSSRARRPGRAPRTATPRAPSGGGAGPSTRARRARGRCRARRRGAGSRRAAAARGSARREPVVAEGGLRLAARGLDRLVELAGDADDAHAAATAAGGRLHEQREAELLGLAVGDDRHAGLARDPLRLELVAAGAQRVGRRADPERGPRRRPPRRSRRSRRGSRSPGGSRRRRLRSAARMCSSDQRYESISTVSSAERACSEPRSSGAATATVAIPSARRGAEDAQRDLAAVRYEELADLHSPASVSAASAESVRYGTASDGRRGDRAADRRAAVWPGAHARLIERERVAVVEPAVLGRVVSSVMPGV